MVKISVVIPVYNVSEFLDESISSLLKQNFNDFELICVNDGSKDDSLEILEEFAKIDDRVKVINKPNGGCGSARNRALDEAHGDYIYFFDPDDYILPSALEVLYNNAINNNSDLVMFKIAWFMDGEPIDYSNPLFNFDDIFKDVDFNNFTFTYKDVISHVLNSGFAPWSKLYKKEFLDKYDDFRFDLGVAFDDVPFHVKSMLRAEKISFAPDFYYHYRYANPNSVNNTSSNGIDIMKIVDIVEDFIKKEGYFEELKEEFFIFKVNQITMYMLSSHSEDYFHLAKKRLLELDINDIKHIPKHIYEKYERTVDSDSFKEYKFKTDFFELKNELINKNNKLTNKNYKLINKNQKLITKNTELLNKNKKLRKENKKLKKENKKLKKFKKEILSSKSLKLTKPLRDIKNWRI